MSTFSWSLVVCGGYDNLIRCGICSTGEGIVLSSAMRAVFILLIKRAIARIRARHVVWRGVALLTVAHFGLWLVRTTPFGAEKSKVHSVEVQSTLR